MLSIIEIIKSVESNNPHINPTIIYNEGWMTRLLVHQSIVEGLILEAIDFSKVANWSSEALISSPFITARNHREGYTHADIAIGDFSVDFTTRGEIKIDANANFFGVIEAKMGSDLSKGTTHVPSYNQASRNLVCIAKNTLNQAKCKTFFYVVAPEARLIHHNIIGQIDLAQVIPEVETRFDLHSDEPEIIQDKNAIISKIRSCDIKAISYEDWIGQLKESDEKELLKSFYLKALHWNRVKNT